MFFSQNREEGGGLISFQTCLFPFFIGVQIGRFSLLCLFTHTPVFLTMSFHLFASLFYFVQVRRAAHFSVLVPCPLFFGSNKDLHFNTIMKFQDRSYECSYVIIYQFYINHYLIKTQRTKPRRPKYRISCLHPTKVHCQT